MKAIK